MTSSRTKPSTPRLSEQARHLVIPDGVVSTGWPAVRKTCTEKLGISFDPWQDSVGKIVLAKREDGTLAAMVDGVGLSLPRQVGKSFLVTALTFGLCINQPGLLVIWTAHHMKTSGETFRAMQAFATREKVAPHVQRVFTGSGDEEVRFHNGSRILYGARERGFGRGIPGVDVLIFDEAQILSDRALSNMLATMNTSSLGLQLYIGTPPRPEDLSESFKRMRREALAGTLVDGAWIEFAADPDAADDDRAQWRKANPSYPKRTPAQSMIRLKRKLTASDWRREGLGIWDSDIQGSRLIPATTWDALAVESPPEGIRSLGIAFSADGSRQAVGGAIKHDDGVYVELVGAYSGSTDEGVSALIAWLTHGDRGAERWRRFAQITISGRSHSEVLVQGLRDAKVSSRVLHVASTADYCAACAMTYEAVLDGSLSHPRAEAGDALEDSVAVCDKKVRTRDGAWGWNATTPEGDDTPIEAVSLALWGARTSKRKPGRRQRVSY